MTLGRVSKALNPFSPAAFYYGSILRGHNLYRTKVRYKNGNHESRTTVDGGPQLVPRQTTYIVSEQKNEHGASYSSTNYRLSVLDLCENPQKTAACHPNCSGQRAALHDNQHFTRLKRITTHFLEFNLHSRIRLSDE